LATDAFARDLPVVSSGGDGCDRIAVPAGDQYPEFGDPFAGLGGARR
jgi:hypothetical protein